MPRTRELVAGLTPTRLVYSSDESGRFEVDGAEIVYRSADGQVMAARFSPRDGWAPGVGRPARGR